MNTRQRQIEMLLAAGRDAFWRGWPPGMITVAQATEFVEQVDRPRLNALTDEVLNELATDPDFLADIDDWSDLNLKKFRTARIAGTRHERQKSNA